jgi:hypothetical protein
LVQVGSLHSPGRERLVGASKAQVVGGSASRWCTVSRMRYALSSEGPTLYAFMVPRSRPHELCPQIHLSWRARALRRRGLTLTGLNVNVPTSHIQHDLTDRQGAHGPAHMLPFELCTPQRARTKVGKGRFSYRVRNYPIKSPVPYYGSRAHTAHTPSAEKTTHRHTTNPAGCIPLSLRSAE